MTIISVQVKKLNQQLIAVLLYQRFMGGKQFLMFIQLWRLWWSWMRSCPLEMFWGKDFLEICSKFTIRHPCRSVISVKLLGNFIEITIRHGCSPVRLLHIFRTYFPKNAFGGLPQLIYRFLWTKNLSVISASLYMKWQVKQSDTKRCYQ